MDSEIKADCLGYNELFLPLSIINGWLEGIKTGIYSKCIRLKPIMTIDMYPSVKTGGKGYQKYKEGLTNF